MATKVANGKPKDLPELYSNELGVVIKKLLNVNPALRTDAGVLLNTTHSLCVLDKEKELIELEKKLCKWQKQLAKKEMELEQREHKLQKSEYVNDFLCSFVHVCTFNRSSCRYYEPESVM